MAHSPTEVEANSGMTDDEACEAIDHERRSYMKRMFDYDQPRLSEAECVYDFEGVVVRERHAGQQKHAHAPGYHDPIKPLCSVSLEPGSDAATYKYKQPGVIPRNYYDPCKRCLKIIRDNGDIDG